MKRRSQPKRSKNRNTYAPKKAAGTMMYGPHSHTQHQHQIRQGASQESPRHV
jgi:hypothetical protein